LSEFFHDIFVLLAIVVPYAFFTITIGLLLYKIEKLEPSVNTEDDMYEYHTEFGHGY
jgi:hypothetical protein